MFEKKGVYKQTVQKTKKRHIQLQRRIVIDLRKKDPRAFWNHLKRNKINKRKGDLTAADFYEYFKHLGETCTVVENADVEDFIRDIDDNNEHILEPNLDTYLDEPITSVEIVDVIDKLKSNKSPGMDGILNDVIINTADIIMPHIVKLFNYIFDCGEFPSIWSEGVVIPLFKKGDANDTDNYRGITLLSCLGKVYTGVLNNRIYKWVEENNVLSDAQFGFRKGRSTVDAIFILQSVILKYLDNNKKLYCAFIDFKKAFDSIYRNGLWVKLYNLGLRGKIWTAVRSMYKVVKSCIRSNGVYSEFFECAVGLRQGEILSPVLFALFIEDLENALQQNVFDGIDIEFITLFLLLFADDAVLMSETPEGLQRSLDTLYEYCSKWSLTVNCDKSKVMVFRKGKLSRNVAWTCNNVHLDVVNQFCYLGSTFTSGGSFCVNSQTLAGKGLKAMNALMAMVKTFQFKPDILCQLFDAFVSSTMSYGAELWGFSKIDAIERVHLKFLKRILGVKISTCNVAVYGELGRYPLWVKWHEKIIKYWFKLVDTENCILNTVYHNILHCNNPKSWGNLVKSLLCRYGFYEVWIYPSSVDVKLFTSIFKKRIVDCYLQKWDSDTSNMSSLFTYNYIKDSHGYETYLSNISVKYRKALTKLRLSSHNLHIETGRHGRVKIDRDLRLCLMCDKEDIEDEYHFVMSCPLYSELRRKYIPSYYSKNPSMYKFIQLMCQSSNSVQKRLAIYIYEAFIVKNLKIRK